MSFAPVRRRGKTWEDAKTLHDMIMNFPFQTTGSNERSFEQGFAVTLLNAKKEYNQTIYSQVDRDNHVQSVYCFGKHHRPDMKIGSDGIAVELKYISYAGLKDAIGQGHLYRIQNKFVFLILIFSEERKQVYYDIEKGKESDLENTLRYLEESMNIFTYLVPSFKLKGTAVRKVIPFSPWE